MANSSNKRASGTRRGKVSGSTRSRQKEIRESGVEENYALLHEIGVIGLFAAMVILFLCNFGVIGRVGNSISRVMFGIFGFTAFVAPILLFIAISFHMVNAGNSAATRKLIAGVAFFVLIGIVCDMVSGVSKGLDSYSIKELYVICSEGKKGGGIISGSLCYLMLHYLETIGTVLVVLLLSAVCIILLTERSLINSLKEGGVFIREKTAEETEKYRRYREERINTASYEAESYEDESPADVRTRGRERLKNERERRNEERRIREEEKRIRAEEKENERILRMEKKVAGVTMDTNLAAEEKKHTSDIHEIRFNDELNREPENKKSIADGYFDEEPEDEYFEEEDYGFEKLEIKSTHRVSSDEEESETETYIATPPVQENIVRRAATVPVEEIEDEEENIPLPTSIHIPPRKTPMQFEEGIKQRESEKPENIRQNVQEIKAPEIKPAAKRKTPAPYQFPPITLLNKGKGSADKKSSEIEETSRVLEETLRTFGVNVYVTDVSRGPSVTRYELQLEQGVKVSKIVNLADDIKMRLAATDIRIEAPIPGKAAVGIEVPNKETSGVALRDLFESAEFKEAKSTTTFGVGKDIAGKTVCFDIAKMPHVLIAGSTGSGKSVCINTLIMSILYKAKPEDVKLIMVDPKVVELSVYNGIPHLLIPVVTEPKKASAALQWGVREMDLRYKKFADMGVRNIEEYNKHLDKMTEEEKGDYHTVLPKIIIIIDELADLMMVAAGEVEEAICRLAQLARAAGIHLVVATQRPSVDVITGLIKANMPSRIAFKVSSGVDSRTILDKIGAEKLLGKGDMLFYPTGYTDPVRVQGAFVSDEEVANVVDFIKDKNDGYADTSDIEAEVNSISSAQGSGNGSNSQASNDASNGRDEYFEQAGRCIIDSGKASVGNLQRRFRIGFNRAANLMDQLCEYGVVSESEGTKPRNILMTMEQFDALLEEI